MYLNSAKVTSLVLNGKDYTGSRKRFMKALCETHNFTVNLVLGNKLLGRGNVSFMENSGWVIAHVDSRFAFDKDEHISGLTISICNNGNEILSSETEVSYFISGNMSTDADLYFMVGSVYAYNDSKEALPESFFRSSNYDRLTKISYEDLPSPVGPEPSTNVTITSVEYKVTNDYTEEDDYYSTDWSSRVQKNAYTVVEADRDEWDAFCEQYGHPQNISLTFSQGDSSSLTFYANVNMKDDINAEVGTISMQDGDEWDSPYVLTTINQKHPTRHEDAIDSISFNIKTYIDGEENTDVSYIPVFGEDYELNIDMQEQGYTPPVINFQYEASSEGNYKFRFSITSIDENERAGFDSASLTFKAWKEADSDTPPYYRYSSIESAGGEYHVDFDRTPGGLGPRGNGIIYKGEGTSMPCGAMIYRVFSYYGDEIQSSAQNISYPASLPMTKITE